MENKKTDILPINLDGGVVGNAFSLERSNASSSVYDMDMSNQIFAVIKGELAFSIKEKDFTLSAGDLVFCPSFSLFSFFVKDDGQVMRFRFGQRYMEDFFECYNGKTLPTVLTDKKANAEIISLFKSFENRTLTEFEKITYTNYVLSLIVAGYGLTDGNGVVDTQISEIIGYIYKNYDKDISLDSLAKEFCISKMVLSRKISRYVGVDLRVFVSDVRVRAYIKMRADKKYASLSAVELAYKCGFKSYETFYRAYKRHVSSEGGVE
ncbi:MAG: helix-turn-helix transcriptional regulator [Clostridia bacterium]|nr:helix-turn-helix transcriptional regulator [Clostridia bacterium]